jgi:hypothetical protein
MMGANASLHADQARREIGGKAFQLAARELALEHNRSAAIETNQVENVFADIDADYGDLGIAFG